MRQTLMAIVLTCLAPSALSWGTEGHQLIARIAEARLMPSARGKIQELLGQEPGETLSSISTWADEHRSPATAAWHYVNFPPDDCHYLADRDCPNGKCVVGAINHQAEVLRTSRDPQQQLIALKYLVHFVGDIHQPLHAGWGGDRGGNSYQLQAFMRGTNLHALWDTGMIRYYSATNPGWDKLVLQQASQAMSKAWEAKDAAEESCRLVSSNGFYPPRHAGANYAEHFEATLTQRLLLAGSRLAQLLNEMWP